MANVPITQLSSSLGKMQILVKFTILNLQSTCALCFCAIQFFQLGRELCLAAMQTSLIFIFYPTTYDGNYELGKLANADK